MRGNKSFKKFFLIVAMLTLSIATCFAFNGGSKKVSAEDNSIYNRSYASQEYDDCVIFSAEQVFFASDRTTQLFYDNLAKKSVSNILGYDGDNYFANYKGGSSTGVASQNDTRSKKIIYPGDFVLVDDIVPMTAYNSDKTAVSLKQGIMLTLGGYIAEKDEQGNVTMYTNSDTGKMSKLTYVSIAIRRDGTEITNTGSGLSLRTYNGGLYFDFVYFLDCAKANEGYYQIDITYILEGQASVSHTFDFYMLLNSSYVDRQEINGQSYASYPEFVNVNGDANKYYQFVDNDKMPVLTYDYKHFDLTYNYQVNDLVSKVVVEYQQQDQKLKFTTTTNNTSSVRYYDCETGNNIVSLLFANIGTYQFNFNYVYYYDGQRLVVDNLSIDSIELKIFGYEVKYARYGFNSATFKKLTINQNRTMIVPVDAYGESEAEMLKNIDLGYVYEIVKDTTQKTGVVTNVKSPKLTATVEGDVEKLTTTDGVTIDKPTMSDQKLEFPSTLTSAQYINTDQGGVWFNLNDEYVLMDSYYVYSNIAFKSETKYDINNFQKDTTFTKLGYYFVCVKYQCDKGTQTQYFAFRISSSTPNVQIMTTLKNEVVGNPDDKRIYSNQYTNKNVYIKWDEPDTFESKLTASLYSSSDKSKVWVDKNDLMSYAKGTINGSLTKQVYQKETVLSANGSYLLEMNVTGSQTKVYYYFVIDKEDISGIETLGVSSATIGDNMIYNVATDIEGKTITYTDNLAISQNFAMWWNDKASGAKITAKYKFAPIVYDKKTDDKQTITNNGKSNTYFTADYKLSNFSSYISIEKPSTQYSVIDADNVLTKQGVYWFYLEDEAGNTMNYMVVLDNTEVKFEAMSGDTKISSGETSSVDVTIDWGDYKVLKLGLKGLNDFVGEDGKNYFKGDKSNYSQIASMWTKSGDGYDLQIANEKMILNCLGKILTLNISGTTTGTNFSTEQLTINNGHSITLQPIMQEMTYTLKVFGKNQKFASDSNSYFTVTLNKDRSEGKIKSTSEDGGEYINTIRTYNDEYNAQKLKANYLTGQATDDGIVVFEWLSGEGTSYEVSEVYYEYYPLMTQEELNNYQNNADYEFYPYSKTSTKHYIYGGDGNAQNYTITTSNGKTIYRSFQINVGRVSYYENNVLTSKYATMPGMYIITRIYNEEVEDDATKRNYVFFVDRNQIIDYSTTNTSSKTVGQYIDLFMQDKSSFDKFSQQSSTISIGENNYNIYLESNKLPLEIRIPTGKYATYNGGIKKTSNSISGGLRFNLIFVDENNYLGLNKSEGASFTLFAMADMQMSGESYVDKGYITYLLNTSNLYMDNGNGGNINRYLNACSKVGTDYLSLPGCYIIEILDNVGITAKADKTYEMEDCNILYLGVRITQNNPSINAYSGKTVAGIVDGNDRVETILEDQNVKLDTNKTYVMYQLPTPNDASTDAQIDDEYIYITRVDETGKEEIYYNSATGSGIIGPTSMFEGYKYIDKNDSQTIIWLDTGIKLDKDNQIVEYKEYQYKIVVRYKLYNNDTGYYTYNKIGEDGKVETVKSYYKSKFTINIDRTPILNNLNIFVNKNEKYPSQKEFLQDYIENVAGYTETAVAGKLDETVFNTIAYRDSTGEINYAVVNKLYYYLLEEGNDADIANYAIRVSSNQKINLSLGKMYYRAISDGSKLVSLVPITSKYGDTGYNRFNETDLASGGFSVADIQNEGNMLSNIFTQAGYYEIVEMDACGNYTQYVILYQQDNGGYNSNLVFNEDVVYTANLNFVTDDGAIKFNASLNIIKAENGQEEQVDTIPLDSLTKIVDMFGNTKTSTAQDTKSFDGTTDYLYKLVLSYKTEDGAQVVDKIDKLWTNTKSFNVADWLFARMGGGKEGNFKLTVVNRFNQTIDLAINISQIAKDITLNYDEFKSPSKEMVGESEMYYLLPSDLIATTPNGLFSLYAQKIVVYDITEKQSYTYSLDSNGYITELKDNNGNSYKYDGQYFVDSEDNQYQFNGKYFVSVDDEDKVLKITTEKIYLTNGHYYNITIYDSLGREIVLSNVYAGEGSNDYKIDCEIATINSNIYYTTNQVTVSYPTNKYSGIKVSIWRDDALIVEESITTESINTKLANKKKEDEVVALVTYDGKTYIKADQNNNSTISFVLCPEEMLNQVSQSGAKLKYEIQYLQTGVSAGKSVVVIDNRVGGISLANEDSISKTNIVRVDYNTNKNGPADFDEETLFKNSPSLSLSETVQLGWEALKTTEYLDSLGTSGEQYAYFSRKIFLYSYSSSEDCEKVELTNASEYYKWISPKENSIGRYVLVYALYNKSNSGEGEQCMMYKAFAFNITSTANAMYEIQDSNGNVQDYDAYLKGSEFATILDKYNNLSGETTYWDTVQAQFGFVAESETNQVGKRFEALNIPIYITNDILILVPNGDNNVASKCFECDLPSSTYKLSLYQIYNNVHTTYAAILSVDKSSKLANTSDLKYVVSSNSTPTYLAGLSVTSYEFGNMYFPYFYKGGLADDSPAKNLVETNKLYLEVYYRFSENRETFVGRLDGKDIYNEKTKSIEKMIEFKTAGSYKIVLKDIAGNTHIWGTNTSGQDADCLILNVVPEVLTTVNDNVPVDYAYYNRDVKVDVCFSNLYNNNTTTIKAYKNGSSTEYITSEGGRKTNYLSSYTFTEYGTYKVEISAKRDKENEITKTIIFSIINPNEARLALDFTSVGKYTINKVTNCTTGVDVSDIFTFLLNEGFIYSKLITFERLSKENAFGSTVGKQTFEVEYLVNNDPLVPARTQNFKFTINNQTPSMQCSLEPGKSTTKEITIKLNPQTIYRQVGDCYVMVNGKPMLTINEDNCQDRILTLTLSEVNVYYVQIVSDSGRVISSFQVEIKEPLNTWSIVLIVAIVLVVVGTIAVFIILRTKMRVR